jgi:hypothetical protein
VLVRAVGYDVGLGFGLIGAGLDLSGSPIACGDWGSYDTVTLYAKDLSTFPATHVPIADIAGDCPQPQIPGTFAFSWTGLRLVAGLDTTGGAKNLEFALWADTGATYTYTLAGALGTFSLTGPGSGAFVTGFGLRATTAPVHNMTGFVGAAVPIADGLTLENITWNGSADPTTSDELAFEGTSASSGGDSHSFESEPPLEFAVDVRVENAAGGAPANDVRIENLDAQGVTVTNPGTATVQLWRPTGTDRYWMRGTLDGTWAAAGIEPVVRDVPLRQIVPTRPGDAPEEWTPVTLKVTSPVDVLLSANAWSAAGSIALSGSGNSTWTVTGAGSVTRVLAGVYDSADGYTTTRHAAGEDVWGWGLYAYLDLNLTADVPATLTVTLTWNTNPSTGATITEDYTVEVAAGTATYRVDLLFPDGGGPTYYERAVQLDLAGFANGEYTLNACELAAAEDVYVKVAAAVEWSGLTLAADGSFPAYWWGENPIYSGSLTRKEEECAEFGGSSQTLGGCVRMDGTLAALVAELSRMEGVTAALATAAIDADLDDGSNVFANLTSADYLASWLHPEMTLRVAANATLRLRASMRFDQCILCPANTGQIVLPFREQIGMVLEALCVDGSGARAGAGFPMVARRSATGTPDPADPVIGSASTDASGFVSVPIPVGQVSASNFTTYLEGA